MPTLLALTLGDCSTAARRTQIGPSLTFHPPNFDDIHPYGPLSDEALLEGIAYGNENVLALVYRRYGGVAYSLAVRIVGDLHGAEAVVQESFLILWRMAHSLNIRRGNALRAIPGPRADQRKAI